MLDVLAIGAHPDDCEIAMAGTICVLKQQSYKVGICDLTAGEAGTYGSAETRKQESQAASKILKLDARITLDLPDGNIRNSKQNRLKLIEVIRQYQPRILFSFYPQMPRHPDHFYAGLLAKECLFLSGLEKIRTEHPPFRPKNLLYFKELIIRDQPDFIVDVTEFWAQKMDAIRAYKSQVTGKGEDDTDTKTFIRSHAFWEVIESRSRTAGEMIGTRFGEPFYCEHPPRIFDVVAAFDR